MHATLTIVDLVCAGMNGYWCYRAFKNPEIYPTWYKIMTGAFTAYCLWAAML